jgi:hypothetical protein
MRTGNLAAFSLIIAAIMLVGSAIAYEGAAGQYAVSFNAGANQVSSTTQENPDMYAFFMGEGKVIVIDYGQDVASYNSPQDMLAVVYGSKLQTQPSGIVVDGKNGAYAIGTSVNGITEHAAVYFADSSAAVVITATDMNLFGDIAGSVHVFRNGGQATANAGALLPGIAGYQAQPQIPGQQLSAQTQTVQVGKYTVTYAGAPPSTVSEVPFGVTGESLQLHKFKAGSDANIAILIFDEESPTAMVNFKEVAMHGYDPTSILTVLFSPLLANSNQFSPIGDQIEWGRRTVDGTSALTGYAYSKMDMRDHYAASYAVNDQALVIVETFDAETFATICDSIRVT